MRERPQLAETAYWQAIQRQNERMVITKANEDGSESRSDKAFSGLEICSSVI